MPNPNSGPVDLETTVLNCLSEDYQLDLPIKKFSITEVKTAINKLKCKKAPRYDLITGKILKELPEIGVRFLSYLFNAIITKGFVPSQWKVAQITMILKPGKDAKDVKSYRPISLLPVLSKLLETLFLKRFMEIVESNKLLPKHQFGFRKKHSTIEQVHRLVEQIYESFEKKEYCAAAFLDISQAFDRVWHDGLLYKLKKTVPTNYYIFIKSYLEHRHFFVKHCEEVTGLYPISAGVPQGSVMGPILYILFTADLPVSSLAHLLMTQLLWLLT